MAASVVLSFLTSGASKVFGALAGIGKAAGGLVQGLGQVGSTMGKLSPIALALTGVFGGLAFAIVKIGRSILQTGQSFDSFRAKFKALYKDITLATEAMNEAVAIAARTPFQVQDVVDVFGAFKAVGLDPTAMLNGKVVMEDMADLAFGMGRSLQDAQWAIKEAAAEGNWRSLMMRFSISKDQIMSTLEAANVTPDLSNPTRALETIRKYIQLQFGGTMEAMSETVQVKISNIADQFSQFKDLIYTSGVSEALVGVLNEALQALEKFFKGDTGQKWAREIGSTFKIIVAGLSSLAPLGGRVLGALWSMLKKIISAGTKFAMIMWNMGAPFREIYKWAFKLISTIGRLIYLFYVLQKRSLDVFRSVQTSGGDTVRVAALIGRAFSWVFDKMMDSMKGISGIIELVNRKLAAITGSFTDLTEEEKETGSVWNEIIDAAAEFQGIIKGVANDIDPAESGLGAIKKLVQGTTSAMAEQLGISEELAASIQERAGMTAAETQEYINYRKGIIGAQEALSKSLDTLEKIRKEWRGIMEEQVSINHGLEDMIDRFKEAEGLMSDTEKNAKGLNRQAELLSLAQQSDDLEGQKKAYLNIEKILADMAKEEAKLRAISEGPQAVGADVYERLTGNKAAEFFTQDPMIQMDAAKRLAELQRERAELGYGGPMEGLKDQLFSAYGALLEEMKKATAVTVAETAEKMAKAQQDVASKSTGLTEALTAIGTFADKMGENFKPEMINDLNDSLERFGLQKDKLEALGLFFDTVTEGMTKLGGLDVLRRMDNPAIPLTTPPPTLGPGFAANQYGSLYQTNPELVELGRVQAEEAKRAREILEKTMEEGRNPVSPSKDDGLAAANRLKDFGAITG